MTISFPFQGLDKAEFIYRALHYAQNESHFAYYQSNQIDYPYRGFEEIMAIGKKEGLNINKESFEGFKSFHMGEWCFGFLGYDLKNQIEELSSENPDYLCFNDIEFFKAKTILFFSENSCRIEGEEILSQIISEKRTASRSQLSKPQPIETKESYIDKVKALRQHIKNGDCYEINFCHEFSGNIKTLEPVSIYQTLNTISPKPFSCLLKFGNQFIISASPERFLKKQGSKIISQPIKGTRPRGKTANEDVRLKTELRNDEKELAENMMIVDLVRNDLAKIAKTGTVKVEEIFSIYSFRQVHQMISTITAEQREDKHFIDVIREAFPMGSMTGAPKIKVMELIEHYEKTKRGAFSGAAGYISPSGDFDFNVLIRSLFLNSESKKYAFQVGSAITYDSIPEKEYEECLVKASAILKVLEKYKEASS